jgi:putative membrane protein
MGFGLILGFVIGILLYALSIWIVSELGLGLKVSGFVPAVIAALVISVVSSAIIWLLGVLGLSLGGFFGAVIRLIIAALVLMFAGDIVRGQKVRGFIPALIAAVAIGVLSWFINGVVGVLF